MIMLNPQSLNEIKKVMLPNNGLKSSKSSESTTKNHSLEATDMLILKSNIGMLLLKPIRRKLNTNSLTYN